MWSRGGTLGDPRGDECMCLTFQGWLLLHVTTACYLTPYVKCDCYDIGLIVTVVEFHVMNFISLDHLATLELLITWSADSGLLSCSFCHIIVSHLHHLMTLNMLREKDLFLLGMETMSQWDLSPGETVLWKQPRSWQWQPRKWKGKARKERLRGVVSSQRPPN